MRTALLALAPLVLGACSTDYLCTTSVEPSIVVEVRDAVTGANLTTGARGAIRQGSFVDSLRVHSWMGGEVRTRAAGQEHAGTFRVTVEHDGYVPWVRNGVVVEEGACHVRTVSVVAELVPVITEDG
jgi:hypothetical protein